jgi:hypothetical protein
VISTFVLVYVASWAVTTAATYVASRRLADHDMTPVNTLCFSLLAGLVWPLVIVGLVEISSVAVYSTAKARRHDSEIPDWWLRGSTLSNVVVPLR